MLPGISLGTINFMQIKQNLGIADRAIRLTAGIVLIEITMSKHLENPAFIISWIFAIILLVTATFGYCPLYGLFGIQTISGKNKQTEILQNDDWLYL
jgi:hypothetical protein